MTESTFDASKYLTNLGGREYLEVKWRLLWLRTQHPDAVIETELMKHEAGLALFRARVAIPEGGVATGWGSETAEDFEDFIEKAETKALGRALAALGYGTQFCEDFDFSCVQPSDGTAGPSAGRGDPEPRAETPGRSAGAVHHAPVGRTATPVVDAPVERTGPRLVRDRGRAQGSATPSQVKAIFSISRDQHGADDHAVEEHCREVYGCLPSELSKRQASEFIDRLRGPRARAGAVSGGRTPNRS